MDGGGSLALEREATVGQSFTHTLHVVHSQALVSETGGHEHHQTELQLLAAFFKPGKQKNPSSNVNISLEV